mgnify:CR=1 FL=1
MSICGLYLIVILAIVIFFVGAWIKGRITKGESNYTEFELTKNNYFKMYDGSDD